jgi:glutathione S-transferase
MLILHSFGPFLGTPDASPFVTKAMLLLELAGLAYSTRPSLPFKAPQGLLPCLEDDGVVIGDSTLIRRHIERKYGHDFDAGLTAEQKAAAWAIERLCEDHLYFGLLDMRWIDRANFERGIGKMMFAKIPAPIRPLVKFLIRRSTAKRLHGHGLGRFPREELAELAIRDVDALAVLLGDKPFLMGEAPCGADATAFGMLTAILTPPLDSALRRAVQGQANLVAYRDRIAARYFPALGDGCSP